jgi:hypothetical protein
MFIFSQPLSATTITVVYALADQPDAKFSFEMHSKNGRANCTTKLFPTTHQIDCMASGNAFKSNFMIQFN